MPKYRPNPKMGFGPDPPPPVTESSRVWLHCIEKPVIYPMRRSKSWLRAQEAMQPPFVPSSHHPPENTLPLEAEVLGLIPSRPSDTPHYESSRPRILPTSTLDAVGPFLDERRHSWVSRSLNFDFLETFSVWIVHGVINIKLNCEVHDTGHMLSTYWGCRLRGSVWGAALLLSIWSLVCCICRSVASRTCK